MTNNISLFNDTAFPKEDSEVIVHEAMDSWNYGLWKLLSKTLTTVKGEQQPETEGNFNLKWIKLYQKMSILRETMKQLID